MKTDDLAELVVLAALWGASFLFMRLGAGEFGPVALAAVLWGLTFLVYFTVFGAMLVRPSLPRTGGVD